MINSMRLFRLLLLFAGILLLGGSVVSAQSNDKSKAITIEPFLQEVILEPADTSKTFSVRVTNNTPSVFNFSLSPVDFGTLNETGGIFFTGTETVKLASKYSLAKWIEIQQTNMSLAPGETAKVDVTLFNRNDLSPGGHYGAIFINSSNTSPSGSKPNINLRQSISALILAVKRGGEKYDLALNSITHNATWFKAPTEVNLRFKNNGNTHVVPRGIVNITAQKGVVHAKGVINESSSYILPETYRVIPVSLQPQKSYPLSLIRTYNVEVNYRYDGLDRLAVKNYSFQLVNWPVLIGLIVFLASGFLAINYQFDNKITKYIKTTIKKRSFKKLFRR